MLVPLDIARSGPARAYGTLRAAVLASALIESAGTKPLARSAITECGG